MRKKELKKNSLDQKQSELVKKSNVLAEKEKKVLERERNLISEEKKIKELIDDLKNTRKHLIDESDIKKELMKSFLEQWENKFYQLQHSKQEIQKLISQTQEIIHEDLHELYEKEMKMERLSVPKIESHEHKNKKEYQKHVKKIKKQLEEQASNKKNKKKTSMKDLITGIEVLINSGNLIKAKKELKKAEQQVKQVKNLNEKQILNYEIQDLKTSIKLAEISI